MCLELSPKAQRPYVISLILYSHSVLIIFTRTYANYERINYLLIFHELIILEVEYVYSLGRICNIAHVMSLNFV
jgi:hypothetical protein